jgi:hypothetical protein
MDNDAKIWLESRLTADEGCEGSRDPTIKLAKLWKSINEEIHGLLKETSGCIAFDRNGKPIVTDEGVLNALWDEMDSRKLRIQAIEDAARKLVAIDGRGLCQLKKELAELQVKASLAPKPDEMVERMYMRNSGRYDRDEIRKLPVVQETERRAEEILAPLRPLMQEARRKVDAYTEILAGFVKPD